MKYLLVILSYCTQLVLPAQPTEWVGPSITCFARDTSMSISLPAIDAVLDGTEPTSNFILDFAAEVPLEARQALNFAASIWGIYLVSDVPIRVEVDWQDRMDARLLASAGPTTVQRAFTGATDPFVWYPVALTEAITGQNQNGNSADIRISVNSTANWYFGTDGQVPFGQIDLVSVTLHELGHGLGFLATTDTVNSTMAEFGIQGLPIIYDTFVEDENGIPITDDAVYPNPSTNLLDLITTQSAFFGGLNSMAAFNGSPPLFTPGLFDIGSSVSHLCEFEFLSGSSNALMTPQLARGEAVQDPGPLALAMLEDMGWTLNQAVVSTHQIELESLKLHPNPSGGWINLSLPEGLGVESRYSLIDLNGRVCQEGKINGLEQEVIDIRGLPSGAYVLLLENDSKLWRQRVLKR